STAAIGESRFQTESPLAVYLKPRWTRRSASPPESPGPWPSPLASSAPLGLLESTAAVGESRFQRETPLAACPEPRSTRRSASPPEDREPRQAFLACAA